MKTFNIECLDCHGAHIAAASQPLADPFDTSVAWLDNMTSFCLSCHNGGESPGNPGCVYGPTIAMRGIDSCGYSYGAPWWINYTRGNTAHGLDSKRSWNGYSGAPEYDMDCMTCHDPHGSYSETNKLGNPYMIADFVDGGEFVDDGARPLGFNSPPWDTYGTSRTVVITISAQLLTGVVRRGFAACATSIGSMLMASTLGVADARVVTATARTGATTTGLTAMTTNHACLPSPCKPAQTKRNDDRRSWISSSVKKANHCSRMSVLDSSTL